MKTLSLSSPPHYVVFVTKVNNIFADKRAHLNYLVQGGQLY